jgi:hypothetical protein
MKSVPYIADGAGREGWVEEESYIKSQERGGKKDIYRKHLVIQISIS